MNNSNKILFLLLALVAFGLGIFFGQQYFHSHDTSQGEVLWNAQLSSPERENSSRRKDSPKWQDSPKRQDSTEQQSQTVSELASKLTLVNFWASWCAPCRKEMPVFESFYRVNKQSGFTIIGVAIDNIAATRPMLDAMGISYPILYAEKTGMEIMAKSGNEQGFLPYSVLYDEQGKVIEAKLGEIDQALLNKWLGKYL